MLRLTLSLFCRKKNILRNEFSYFHLFTLSQKAAQEESNSATADSPISAYVDNLRTYYALRFVFNL